MGNKFSGMDFQQLIEHVKTLSSSEKLQLLQILDDTSEFVLREERAVYQKNDTNHASFESQWNESLSIDSFKSGVLAHLDELPWN